MQRAQLDPYDQHARSQRATQRPSALVLAWPAKRLLTWYFFAFVLHSLRPGWRLPTVEQEVVASCALLVLALLITVLARSVASPLLGLAAKWLIMGRARPGNYRLWGQYYLRWAMASALLLAASL